MIDVEAIVKQAELLFHAQPENTSGQEGYGLNLRDARISHLAAQLAYAAGRVAGVREAAKVGGCYLNASGHGGLSDGVESAILALADRIESEAKQ